MNAKKTKSANARRNIAASWGRPAIITKANLFRKSFANWAFNPIDGCSYGCPFCFVPEVSTCHLAPQLSEQGVTSPDGDWGNYQLIRTWDDAQFIKSLNATWEPLKPDCAPGWRSAILMSSTTDPYQPIAGPNIRGKQLQRDLQRMRRRALELILNESSQLVRVLTRSPLASRDFELFREFGPRLTFGMSLPTLREDLIRMYEPNAPKASERLKTLHRAKKKGLHVYVVISPIYPDCDESDLRDTLEAVAALDPITIFCEPLNVRGGIAARVLNGMCVPSPCALRALSGEEAWQDYAFGCLRTVQVLSEKLGIQERIHLWPAKSLGDEGMVQRMPDPSGYRAWLDYWWNRESEWPACDVYPYHVPNTIPQTGS